MGELKLLSIKNSAFGLFLTRKALKANASSDKAI